MSAGDMRNRLAQSMSRPAAPPTPESARTEDAQQDGEALTKFTVTFDMDTADNFDRLSSQVRRLLGRSAAKADIVRALVNIASEESTLREQVADELRNRKGP